MQTRTLIPTGIAVAATAILGGLASRPAQSAWYEKLKKPPYQPPRQAFPIVWPILYADIAVTSAATLDELERTGPAARASCVHRRVGVQPGAQRQLVVAVLQPASTRNVGDRRGRVDGQQRGPDQAVDGRAGCQGRSAGRLSRVVRVRHRPVDPHLGTQPLRRTLCESSTIPGQIVESASVDRGHPHRHRGAALSASNR